MEQLKIMIGDIIEERYSQCERTGSELNSFNCAGEIVDFLVANNLLKEEQLALIEIKECIDDAFGQDCAYYNIDGFKIAKNIYDRGFRLCHEKRA